MNAFLPNPADIGAGVMNAFQQGRQTRAEQETRNALSGLVMNPDNPQAMAQLAAHNPQAAMAMQERQAQRAAAQQQKQQGDMGMFRKLLKRAATGPEGLQQAIGAAQSMGLDLSGMPQNPTPEWAQQQLFILDAVERPEGAEALSTAGKVAADMGFKPGTPEHAKATRDVFLADASKPYTGGQGETRLYIPQIGGGQPAPPQPGTIVGGYTFKGGNPNDANSWEQAGGPTQPASGTFP